MKIKEVPGLPGAPAIVLYHEQIDDDNMHTSEIYMRIKVLTEAGRERANVEVPYSRKHFRLGDIFARTVHADGSIVNFEGKPFDKTVLRGRGRKINVKAFTLPDVQVGSIIEYRYTIFYDDHTMYAPTWMVQDELFQSKVHFVFRPYMDRLIDHHGNIISGAKIVAAVPKGTKPVLIEDRCAQKTATLDHSCTRIVYDATNMAAFPNEPFMPPADMLKYNVRFYYDSDRKQEDFWRDEGKYWNKDVEKFIGDDAALKAELAKIVAPSDSPEQKVRKIYAYVQSFTNLSFVPEKTDQELKALGLTEKYSAEKVIAAKTGDREDLNRLFIGLVRQAGIPAYAMRVTDREEANFIPQVLEWGQLNSELAIVKLGDTEVFLDPGTRFCPYGLLLWNLTSTQGVRQSATGKGTEFAKTPGPSYKDAQTKRNASLTLSSTGVAQGTLSVTYVGQEALKWRIRGAKTDAEGRTKLLEDEVKGWLPNTAEISLINKPEWNNGEVPMTAEFKISSPMLTSAGRRRLLPPQVFEFNKPAIFQHAERKTPVYLDFPYSEVDDIRVTLPEGMTPEGLPAAEQVKVDFAVYATEYAMQGRDLLATRVMGVGDNYFPLEYYAKLKSFYEKVKSGDDQHIVLMGGAPTSVTAK